MHKKVDKMAFQVLKPRKFSQFFVDSQQKLEFSAKFLRDFSTKRENIFQKLQPDEFSHLSSIKKPKS